MVQLALLDIEKSEENTFSGFAQKGNWSDEFGSYLRQYSKNNYPEIRTLSLFSGAGGLDIGFHDAGFNILSTVEIEPAFANTLTFNSGSSKYFGKETAVNCIDIKEFCPDFDGLDFIIGGPPCQTFSAAGARAMGVAGTKDERGNLFLEYVRLLSSLKPKGFLFENVYRIIGANKGKDWEQITKAFSNVGYKLFYRILDTADYGVPQHRERLIIIGVREDIIENRWFLFPRPTHGPDSRSNLPHFASQLALNGLPPEISKKGLSGKYGYLLKEIPPGLNYSFFTERMGHPNPLFAWRSKFSDFLYKADPERPVRTIKAQGGQYTGPFHWENRVFTNSELKRLQTFPDNYEILGGRGCAIHQIGNSVPPQFARILALSILDQLFNVAIPIDIDYLAPNEKLSFRQRKYALSGEYKLKAERAIQDQRVGERASKVSRRLLSFDLSEKFAVTIHNSGKYLANSYLDNDTWIIDLTLSSEKPCKPSGCLFDIQIAPKNEWAVPASKIMLRSHVKGLHSYTAVWKILDWLLQHKNIKADLVQLCGYYQYVPAFKAVLKVHKKGCLSSSAMETFLQSVCNDDLTKRSVHILDMSNDKKATKQQLTLFLKELKEMGYEVRSSRTNLSIDNESYLIPYAFPTLSPQSVQLNKKL